jgi:surfactin synthase thioesterase subunit
VEATALDLPSHLRDDAGRADDVAVLNDAISAAREPVVVLGWSYGGSLLNDVEPALLVRRLLYVSAVPAPATDAHAPDGPPADMTHLVFGDGTVVLDQEWFTTRDPAVATMTPDVVEHLRAHPRRAVSLDAILAPPTGTAWLDHPTTVIIGRDDPLLSDAQRDWSARHVADTRLVDGDHFLPWRCPALIADAALAALER